MTIDEVVQGAKDVSDDLVVLEEQNEVQMNMRIPPLRDYAPEMLVVNRDLSGH